MTQKAKPNQWRIWWHQKVDGKVLVKWHTGTEAECRLLGTVCEVNGEKHWYCEPGTFK